MRLLQFGDGEDALQGDAEAQRQERLHVEMRLAAADVGDASPAFMRDQVRAAAIERSADAARAALPSPAFGVAGVGRCALRDVRVRRQLGDRQRVRLLAAALAERVAAADVDRRAAAQVGQREVDPAVAAEGRAEQREQRLVLVDRQQLPVAQRPALGREDEGHDPDFGQEWFGHVSSPADRSTYLTLSSTEFKSFFPLRARPIKCHNPSIDRRPALVDAELQEVVERVDVRRGHVRVRRQIVQRVEGVDGSRPSFQPNSS